MQQLDIRAVIKERVLYFDGAMGTMISKMGASYEELPEELNITSPDIIRTIHEQYLAVGSDIIKTNTFGASRLRLENSKYTVESIVNAAMNIAKEAVDNYKLDKKRYIAIDLAPTGKLLEPFGTLTFEEAYEIYKEIAQLGAAAGADLVIVETMSDAYELKAAVLAAKDHTKLPVVATVTLDERGQLLTGGNIKSVIAMLEGLRVDGLGINCGLGPKQMLGFVQELAKYASIPIFMNPNAGLPETIHGETVYHVSPEEFGLAMAKFIEEGAQLLGGCCGTTPAHIEALINATKNKIPNPVREKDYSVVASGVEAVFIGEEHRIIGERINPTGKKLFKQALRQGDLNYALKEGIIQQDNGAQILDVNVGLPEIDETTTMVKLIKELQGVVSLPLQIDSTNPKTVEAALRIYNGKALINSVNGDLETMEAIFPLVKRYGGMVVGLTLDKDGIPETAQGKLEIAKRIIHKASEYGIGKKDILIDVLTLAISSGQEEAKNTLEALRLIKSDLGVYTVLGVSNVSFSLPQRAKINAAFYLLAMQNGLDVGIINPNESAMMDAVVLHKLLSGKDPQCTTYINKYGVTGEPQKPIEAKDFSIQDIIVKGLKERAYNDTVKLLRQKEPLDIINQDLVPALDIVGQGFEKGTIFLPQLLMSAETVVKAFEAIKAYFIEKESVQEYKGKVVLATVKGDIHDIGKNIVKVLLESYGYEVIDLGKDVAVEKIINTVKQSNTKLLGLSALMTTTVVNMEKTILALKEENIDCKVVVGGAVLTPEYAEKIGADCYAKDAMATINYGKQVYNTSHLEKI